MIVSCCVLHNICIEMGDLEPPEEIDAQQQAPRDVPVPAHQAGNADNAKRTAIVLHHFSR